MVAVADSSSSCCLFSFECGFPGLVKNDLDHGVRRLSFFGVLDVSGNGKVGGGSKKGIAEVTGEVGRREVEQRDR